ncbi:MAG: alpha-L-rhamnosidase-related protein [Planctomycetota bacterium]|jgi:alpha-L-rhamnosidase
MHNRFTLLAAICVFGVTVTVTALWSGGCGTSGICRGSDRRYRKAQGHNPDETVPFRSAKPIWPKGRETETNLFVGFRAVFERPKSGTAVLRITGSSLYRIFLNGRFLGHGPARGPHGYWRVDQWPLKGLGAGENVLAVEVAGYNVNSYYLLDQPSFIQAEIVAEGRVLASTAGKGVPFEACILKGRVQKVQRYSFQRPFIEYYRLEPDYDRWRKDKSAPFVKARCETFSEKKLLPRRVAYPRFSMRQPVWRIGRGRMRTRVDVDHLWKGRELTRIGPKLKGFTEDQLEVVPSIELQKIEPVETVEVNEPYSPADAIHLDNNSFVILDLGTNLTGFIGARVKCREKTGLFITFDEILSNGDVDFKRLRCVNAVGYELKPGEYRLETFEPYTMRYLKLLVREGSCEATNLYLREYANPDASQAHFACSDRRLNRIFEAARQTFRQNAVDIFMDCPSRERAGWLCDSFFTGRVAFDLCGNTTVEKNFFENYLLPARFEHHPEGMLPMCYPADHYNKTFIPNWAMWFVIQLEEYLARSGDRELVDALRPKVMSLLKYFERFRNEDGLLEKLESWVFVEWSAANRFVQDVSYPTNMLYAAVLEAAGRMYKEPDLLSEAERLREAIRRQSFDGEFFVDNAMRQEGKLQVTDNKSEVCQYFAFFFDAANLKTHGKLWDTLRQQFGPARTETKAYPQVHPANSFVGNYLRLELLSRFGHCRQLKDELVDFFLYMAERTGTLWEHTRTSASCNHGFASHVAHCLYRDILGVHRIDMRNRVVELHFSDVGLEWCRGKMPTRDGVVSVRWWTEDEKIFYQADVPAGYTLRVKNLSGRRLVHKQ